MDFIVGFIIGVVILIIPFAGAAQDWKSKREVKLMCYEKNINQETCNEFIKNLWEEPKE